MTTVDPDFASQEAREARRQRTFARIGAADKWFQVLGLSWVTPLLRAAAGELYNDLDDVDYFPSYELVTNPTWRGESFETNLRSVKSSTVAHVMTHYRGGDVPANGDVPKVFESSKPAGKESSIELTDEETVACEEAMLEAFG